MNFELPAYIHVSMGIFITASLLIFLHAFLRRSQKKILFLRLITIFCLAVALPGPFLEIREPTTDGVVLLDISDSFDELVAQENLDRVKKIAGSNISTRYLPFAGKASPFPEIESISFREAKRTWNSLDIGETNLEDAFQQALSTGSKNLFIVSDGWQTRGDVANLFEGITSRGVRLFPIVSDSVDAASTRLELTKLTAPIVASAEKSVDIRATIRNDFDTEQAGLLELNHGGRVIQKKMVKLRPGQESVIVGKSDPSKEGIQEVVATFTPVNPKLPPSSKTIFVSGQKREKVLMLSGTSNDARLLNQILENRKYRLDSFSAPNVVSKNLKLSDYSVILLNNISSADLPPGFAREFESFIRTGGGGAMIGGNKSFGLGGYLGSLIEKALPVDMVPPQSQQKRLNVAVSLVLDKSRSMANEDKIYYVKEAAGAVVNNLKDDDFIEVIGFDSSPFVVIKMSPLASIRAVALDRIARIFPAGRTNLLPAMHESRRSLVKAAAGRKHMIILTDGQVPDAGPYYMDLIQQMRAEGITVSTVLLGAESDTEQLRQMAKAGGGAFHQTTNPASLAKIFIDDIRVSTGEKTLVESEQFNVRRGPASQKITTISAFPPLRGYVQTKPKSKSDVELVVMHDDKAAPLLATWRYGEGKALAFTSDANGRWSSFWVTWDKFYNFWVDAIESLRDGKGHTQDNIKFDLRYKVEQGVLKLDLSVFSPDVSGALSSQLTFPNGEEREIVFIEDSPGRYLAEVPGVTAGKYNFKANIGKKIVTPLSFVLSGDLFGEKKGRGFNLELLNELAALSGGMVNPEAQDVLRLAKPEVRKVPLTFPLVAIAAILFLLEILIREVGHLIRGRAPRLRA